MRGLLEEAVVLITGAAGAIGSATCASLAEAGACVIGSDLSDPETAIVEAWMRHDVTSAADWQKVVGAIQDKFGRLDCLVNGAGICVIRSICDTSPDLWQRMFTVNVESIFLGVRTCLPLLCESGAQRIGGSSIVNLSSAAGLVGVPFAAAYCASKGAVTLLTKAAAKEFAALKYPVRVNSVHPSAVESPMAEKNFAQFVETGGASTIDSARTAAVERNPMGRLAKAQEIANGIVFLCSPASSFMNGSEFVIDGGVTA